MIHAIEYATPYNSNLQLSFCVAVIAITCKAALIRLIFVQGDKLRSTESILVFLLLHEIAFVVCVDGTAISNIKFIQFP